VFALKLEAPAGKRTSEGRRKPECSWEEAVPVFRKNGLTIRLQETRVRWHPQRLEE
jgi:hypothetical protein